MKFKDYNYERYSYEAYAEAMQQAGTRLKEAKDYQSFKKAFDEGKRAFEHLDTMYNIVMSAIRSIQTMPFIRRKTITGTRQCRR